jgi:hypothetical protein
MLAVYRARVMDKTFADARVDAAGGVLMND